LRELVRRIAARVSVPLIAGGTLTTLEDVDEVLAAGARKATLNDAAVADPDLLRQAVERHGGDRIVLAIDVREERRQTEIEARPEVDASHAAGPPPVHNWFRVFTHGSATPTPLDAITWARRGVELGAREILITSIDRHGSGEGYDLELTARMNEAVDATVIAGGGAGSAEHIRELFLLAGADGAVVGGLFHDGRVTVGAVKRLLSEAGMPVRLEPPPLLS
jgi:cyclase